MHTRILWLLILYTFSFTSWALPFKLSYDAPLASLPSEWQYLHTISENSRQQLQTSLQYCGIERPFAHAEHFIIPIYFDAGLHPHHLINADGRRLYLSGREHWKAPPTTDPQRDFVLSQLFKTDSFQRYVQFYRSYQASKPKIKLTIFSLNERFKCIGTLNDRIFHASITAPGYGADFYTVADKVIAKYPLVSDHLYQVKHTQTVRAHHYCRHQKHCYFRRIELSSNISDERIQVQLLVATSHAGLNRNIKLEPISTESISYTHMGNYKQYQQHVLGHAHRFQTEILPAMMSDVERLKTAYQTQHLTDIEGY